MKTSKRKSSFDKKQYLPNSTKIRMQLFDSVRESKGSDVFTSYQKRMGTIRKRLAKNGVLIRYSKRKEGTRGESSLVPLPIFISSLLESIPHIVHSEDQDLSKLRCLGRLRIRIPKWAAIPSQHAAPDPEWTKMPC